MGSDYVFSRGSSKPQTISIHAPAWGATCEAGILIDVTLFQSTLPRGERLASSFFSSFSFSISIHAPAWGATAVSLQPLFSFWDFNPRSRVGSDSKRSQSKGESSVYLCINSPNITSFLYSIILFYKFQPQILVRTSRQFSVYFHFAL